MIRRTSAYLCLSVVLIFSCADLGLEACGGNFDVPVFSLTKHPDYPIRAYAQGELGLVEPSFYTPYLFMAYRSLSGKPFSDRELVTLRTLWSESAWNQQYPELRESASDPDIYRDLDARTSTAVAGLWPVSFYRPEGGPEMASAVQEWLGERSRVTGPGGQPQVNVFRGPSYSGYLAFSASSFVTAAQTLRTLIERLGGANPQVQEWVKGQDQVYSITETGASIPADLPADAPVLFRQHRAYQIASALFYAERFDEAIQAFDRISKDADSPWRDWGDYLVARCLIRKASLLPKEEMSVSASAADWAETRAREQRRRTEILRQAETRLKTVLANQHRRSVHQAAGQSLALVLFRLSPAERLVELSRRLTTSNDPFSTQDLIDCLWLLMNWPPYSNYTTGSNPASGARDLNDMIDWILCFQGGGDQEAERAYLKWARNSESTPWLVAALRHAKREDPQLKSLLDHAQGISKESPAYVTVSYHRARLYACLGQHAEAASVLDGLLALKGKPALRPGSRNRVSSLRFEQASNLDELVTSLPRQMIGVVSADDTSQILREAPDSMTSKPDLATMIDEDALQALPLLPLELLRDVTLARRLPTRLQAQLARRIWTRAAVLEQWAIASSVSPVVRRALPGVETDLVRLSKLSDAKARQRTASMIMLRERTLFPVFARAACGEEDSRYLEGRKRRFSCAFPLLNARDRQNAAEQEAALCQHQPWANHFCRVALDWAEDRPQDPLVPEALHRAVVATRQATLYNADNEETGDLSRRCFEVLHKRYPKSPWTAKTRYWYR